MERIKIDKDIYLYRFEKALGHFVGLNTVVIENGNEALLIDTGYEENFLEPELRPEYVEKIENLEKSGKFKRYKSLKSLRKEIEHA